MPRTYARVLHSYLLRFEEYFATFESRYDAFFHIGEVRGSVMLKWFFGASLLFFLETFYRLIDDPSISIHAAQTGTAVCWPYFQSCYKLFFLQPLPWGYTQSEFYMVLFAVMLLIAWQIWIGKWARAHMLMLPLFLWKSLVIFVLSYQILGPYDYYHLILTAILLFIPFKEYFLRLTFVFFYFMAATTKFDPTWTLGTYFTVLKTGLPIFPTAWTPIFTNLVIFMQVVGAWFLLSRNMLLQRLSLVFFLIFHLYSGIFVLYLYPLASIPALLILFGPWYRYEAPPFRAASIAGWILIILIALFQVVGFVVPGDRRFTLQGDRFGMFMFEANHECIATVTTYSTGTTTPRQATPASQCNDFYCLTDVATSTQSGHAVETDRYESDDSWNRCDPYDWWSRLHLQCTGSSDMQPSITRIAFTLDHSINGGPFYRIVDVPDICAVAYHLFEPNMWIKVPPEALVVGKARQDVYSY